MSFTLLRDSTGVPVAGYDSAKNVVVTGSVGGSWRDDFPGASLDTTTNWEIVQTGAGMTITVSGGVLTIASGTTANAHTIIRSRRSYRPAVLLQIIARLSQRIANQDFFIELVSADATHACGWQLLGTTATAGRYFNTNTSLTTTSSDVTINTTASDSMFEIELLRDRVFYHSRTLNSTRAASYMLQTNVPSPALAYFVRIRVLNGATPPASSTNFIIDAVHCLDISEQQVEVIGGRGSTMDAQSMPVRLASGSATIGNISTVTTLTTMTTGNIQSINTAYADTSTALAANAVFNGTARDFTATQRVNEFRASSTSDVAGTLFIEQSSDGTNWNMTHRQDTTSVADADATTRHIAIINAMVCARYARVRYRNGATPQTVFRLISMQTGI